VVTYGMTGLSGVGTPSVLRFLAFFAGRVPGPGTPYSIIDWSEVWCPPDKPSSLIDSSRTKCDRAKGKQAVRGEIVRLPLTSEVCDFADGVCNFPDGVWDFSGLDSADGVCAFPIPDSPDCVWENWPVLVEPSHVLQVGTPGSGDIIFNYRLDLCMVSPKQFLTRDRRHRFGDTIFIYRLELCMESPEQVPGLALSRRELGPRFRPVPVSASLLEEIGVRCGATEFSSRVVFPVDQQPIWLDVTISPTLPLAAEGMVSVLGIERPASAQGLYDRMELVQGLTALLLALHVSVELGRRLQDQGRRRLGRLGLSSGHA
jgi:hypothetical protein